jgi:hypothetical protein
MKYEDFHLEMQLILTNDEIRQFANKERKWDNFEKMG